MARSMAARSPSVESGEAAAVRVAAEGDDVADRQAGRMRARLRQQRDPPGEVAGRQRSDVPGGPVAVPEPDRPAPDLVEPGERAQDGGLAAAVGADERGDRLPAAAPA